MTCIHKEEKGHDRKDGPCTIITIPDESWDKTQIILPKEKRPKTVGRPIVPYRKVVDGILYVLRTGCQWKLIPKEFGSGSTCHRRFQEWNNLDIFKKTWTRLLKNYDKEIGINWTWQSIDRQYIHKVTFRGAMTGNNPTDRSKLGKYTKRHILTDKKGIPLSVVISPASTHDINLVTEVVDYLVIKRRPSSSKSKSRGKLQHLCLDKACNSNPEEQKLIKLDYVLHIPYKRKKGQEDKEKTRSIPHRKKHSSKRWVVERTNSWHNRFRKLFTRYEKKAENYLGLVQFSCCIIIYRKIILG